MKIIIACLTTAVVALLIVTGGTVNAISGDGSQIASLRGQVSALHAQAARQATATAQVNGSHRDLLTCADLQQLVSAVNSVMSPISLDIYALYNLPAHCINH